jgi:lipid A 3-O-deacylase
LTPSNSKCARLLAAGLAGMAAVVMAPPVVAQQTVNPAYTLGPVTVHGREPDMAMVGLGQFDFGADIGDPSFGANLEYRLGRKLWVIGPSAGLSVNTRGGVYGYLGIYADLSIGRVVVTPQLAAGGWRRGKSADLGGVFEFRQSLDVAWRFENGWRAGIRVTHISNANIYDENPGVEELFATLAVPLGPIF